MYGLKISDSLEEVYDRLTGILGGKTPMDIRVLVDGDFPTSISATLSEREWHLLRFAIERAMESI